MNLKILSDDLMYARVVRTSRRERAITLKLLRELNEVERRRLYSNYNCSSLHVFCVKELKMTDGDASRKVAAARLLKEVPSIEVKVLEGSIAITSVSQIGSFFKKEAEAGQTYSKHEKLELITQLEEKSTREIQSILIAESVKPETHFRESVKEVAPGIFEVKTYVTQEQLSNFEKLRSIWSHAMPKGLLSDVFARSAEESVQKHDPLEKANRATERRTKKSADRKSKIKDTSESSELISTATQEIDQQVVPEENFTPALERESESWVSHQVWLRDQGECTFVDPRTGECCESKHFLEEDHIIPKAMGGQYTVENMRLRCRAHNLRHAINSYGEEKMSAYLN